MCDSIPPQGQSLTRRQWLRRAVLAGTVLPFAVRAPLAHAGSDTDSIPQPEAATPQAFMLRAFAMRQQAEATGDQPYGAVVVRSGRIIGQSPSLVVVRGDPAAHAEREAIYHALSRVGGGDLAGSILYSTSRPCPMCERVAGEAAVARMIHGADLTDAGPPRTGRG